MENYVTVSMIAKLHILTIWVVVKMLKFWSKNCQKQIIATFRYFTKMEITKFDTNLGSQNLAKWIIILSKISTLHFLSGLCTSRMFLPRSIGELLWYTAISRAQKGQPNCANGWLQWHEVLPTNCKKFPCW